MFTLFSRHFDFQSAETYGHLIQSLLAAGARVGVWADVYDQMVNANFREADRVERVATIDAVRASSALLSVGGDGTFLAAAKMVMGSDVPVLGINRGRLGFLSDVAPDQLQQAVSDLIEGKYFEESYSKFLKGYKAINVTAPFKEAAYEKADVVSGPAALIGAANILVKGEDGVSCHNSDFTGIILCVAEALFPGITIEFYGEFGERAHIKIHQFVRDRLKALEERPKALIVSCGGAGKAAAVAAAELGCEVWILNRSLEKAEKFVKGLPEYRFRTGGLDEFKERLRISDLRFRC